MSKGRIAIDYGVTGIPEKYFINGDGILVKKFIGPMNEVKLRQVLDRLLAQTIDRAMLRGGRLT